MTLRLDQYYRQPQNRIARLWFNDHRNTNEIARRLGLQEFYVDRVIARILDAVHATKIQYK